MLTPAKVNHAKYKCRIIVLSTGCINEYASSNNVILLQVLLCGDPQQLGPTVMLMSGLHVFCPCVLEA